MTWRSYTPRAWAGSSEYGSPPIATRSVLLWGAAPPWLDPPPHALTTSTTRATSHVFMGALPLKPPMRQCAISYPPCQKGRSGEGQCPAEKADGCHRRSRSWDREDGGAP